MSSLYKKVKNIISSINNKYVKTVKSGKLIFRFLPNNIYLLILFILTVIVFIITYLNHDNTFYSIKNIVILIYLIIFFVINYCINRFNIKPENIWLIYLTIYIISSSIYLTPFNGTDEYTHFFSAYRLTQTENDLSNIGSNVLIVPNNIFSLFKFSLTQNRIESFNEFNEAIENTNNKEYMFPRKYLIAYKVPYIFMALGIKIADIFCNSPLIIFYTGRVVNTLICGIIIYLCLKYIKKHKLLLLSFVTIPMFSHLLGTYSYDSTLLTMITLFYTLLINMCYSKNNNLIIYYTLFLLIDIFIINCKGIYIPILLFMFIIPRDNFKNSNKYIYIISIILLSLILGIKLQHILSGNIAPFYVYNNPINLLNKPKEIILIIYNTLKRFALEILIGIYGKISWYNHQFMFSLIYIFTYSIYIIYLVKNESMININHKYLYHILIIFIICTLFGTMYMIFTEAGGTTIYGVHGRYILVLIPFIIMLLLKGKESKIDSKIVYTYSNIMLLHYITLLLENFYGV